MPYNRNFYIIEIYIEEKINLFVFFGGWDHKELSNFQYAKF